jgi:hypothetical protein
VPDTPLAAPRIGGLLVTPKATDAAAPGAAPTAPGPGGGPSAAPLADDLSPRARAVGDAPAQDGSGPSAEAAQLGLPEQLDLGDLFPTAPVEGAGTVADAAAPTGPAPAGEAVADYGSPRSSKWPLIAGMAVALAILAVGAGLLWWRNRDVYYFPA